MVSARVKITLFPAGGSTSAIGDLPTWTLTIKGSRKWSIDVPYLQIYSWSLVNDTSATFVPPVLQIQLLESIPQPFDKAVSLYVATFGATNEDVQFACLQSVVPRPSSSARFQNIFDDFDMPVEASFGISDSNPYMGGIVTVRELLNRYSSRGIDGMTVASAQQIPYPGDITSWADLYAHWDNFDYVSNLYKFYTGETQIKAVFSGAPTSGVITAYINNASNAGVGGSALKAGNSMAITHQAIWPELDLVFPYLAQVPYNGIQTTDKFAVPAISFSDGSVISKFLISAAPNFELFYRMPVPDFYYGALPEMVERTITTTVLEEEPLIANFQSFVSLQARKVQVVASTYTGDGSTNFANIITLGYDVSNSIESDVEFWWSLRRGAGTTDQDFLIVLGDDDLLPSLIVLTDGISYDFDDGAWLAVPVMWKDVSANGRNVVSGYGAVSTQGDGSSPLTSIYIYPISTPPELASTWFFTFTIKYANSRTNTTNVTVIDPNFGPSDGNLELLSNQYVASLVSPDLDTLFAPIPLKISATDPLPVDIVEAEISIGVIVENELPIEILISETQLPLPVDVEEWDTSAPVLVAAAPSQDTPLWVTQYGPP